MGWLTVFYLWTARPCRLSGRTLRSAGCWGIRRSSCCRCRSTTFTRSGNCPPRPRQPGPKPRGASDVHQNAPLRRRDGSIFYADIVNNYVDYAGRHCVICFYRDITERKRAEEALRQSRDELQAIYEGMLEGLLILDSETKRIVEVNFPFAGCSAIPNGRCWRCPSRTFTRPTTWPGAWNGSTPAPRGASRRTPASPCCGKTGASSTPTLWATT